MIIGLYENKGLKMKNNTINTTEFSKLIYCYWSNYYRNLDLEEFNKKLNEDIKGFSHEEVIQWLQYKNNIVKGGI
ncbi:hypothetical protein [Clostridium sp. ZBS18]|uniref:hypothetical protein n=1 Tax=Clostridium sp. ZBS18 TaxID=2949967 RepID=UPI0020796D32|nr:hypothetical protein [Clostridium sp. ZBS18]